MELSTLGFGGGRLIKSVKFSQVFLWISEIKIELAILWGRRRGGRENSG